jgi:diaminopimelate decarboxylase
LILHICANPESEDPNALFGCAPDKAPALLQLAIQLGLNCVGISFSIGADCIRPSLFAEAIELSASLFQIGTTFGHHMTILNIGDGFSGPLNEYQYSQFGEVCRKNLFLTLTNTQIILYL